MATFTVICKGGEVEVIDGADTYEQEGPLTTFFQVAADRRVIDCWSVRLMSVRTADIAMIRRETVGASAAGVEPAQRRALEQLRAVG